LILSVSKKVRVFDLIHDFVFESNKVNASRLAAQYARCEKRIFISYRAIEETKKLYAYKFMDDVEYKKIELIPNYTEIPIVLKKKTMDGKLNVLYVGRGTSEKRAHLVGEIAIACNKITDSIKFTAIGALENTITPSYKKYVDYTGPINDFNELRKYYETNHIVLITSEREGFPLTIMEGMAHGLIAISTPVGDVPLYVNDKVGMVTSSIDEKTTVMEMTNAIIRFSQNRRALNEMSEQAFLFAQQHFSKQQFFDSYKNTVKMD
jgi:glycosyltransferase involved in cell wall biosynthesis